MYRQKCDKQVIETPMILVRASGGRLIEHPYDTPKYRVAYGGKQRLLVNREAAVAVFAEHLNCEKRSTDLELCILKHDSASDAWGWIVDAWA